MSTSPIPRIEGTTQIWEQFKSVDEDNRDKEEAHRTSLYVEVFQSIHDIVMEQEKYLFSSDELACFHKINAMSYAARYLLIRLCLRKRGKWHSVTDLEKRYKIEIGGKERIFEAIDELCGIVREVPVKVKDETPDIIDLTHDDWEQLPTSRLLEQSDQTNDGYESPITSTPQNGFEHEAYVIAEDDANATLPELLDCLTQEELKSIGKQLKVTRTGQNRISLSDAIISNASNQKTLTFPVLTPCNNDEKAKGKGKSMLQPSWMFSRDTKMKNGVVVVRKLVLKSIGRCIRISHNIFSLFDRLNIVYFRSTNHSSSLLLPALLTAFRKRRHAATSYVRTNGVFPSRQALLDYEEYLALEARIEEAFSGQTQAVLYPSSKKTRGESTVKEKESSSFGSRRVEEAQVVRDIWSKVYDRWKVLVVLKDKESSPGLERFDCGHVLTRIVCKGAEALGILKEYELQIEVLEALLAQTKWRKGKRGAWYDRLALVLMTHSEKTRETMEMAMDVVIGGLRDNLTYLIYRPRLERRLARLEKKLNVPMRERHKCDGVLKKAREIYIEGVRVKNHASSVNLDKSGCIKGTIPFFTGRSKSVTPSTMFSPPTQPFANDNKISKQNSQPWKGKTLWLAKNGEEVSVEQFALEYYYGLGFKGFHSEGRIVSTIFGLLFWDVIFASVPGAFETPFQTAPLDIFEDGFYLARREQIEQRLAALENGDAHQLVEEVLIRERPHRTSCIGIDWDFEPEDLINIVDCLGGHALAIICQVLCERYGQWQGGVPDLLVWNTNTRECRFVEVKSPNDRLQENQKVWIDVLISSDTLVDLCHVVEKGEKGKKARKRSQAPSRIQDPGTSSDADSIESELDDLDHQLPSQMKKRKIGD